MLSGECPKTWRTLRVNSGVQLIRTRWLSVDADQSEPPVMTYELPAIGRPPDGPPLEKIAVEEHFDALGSGGGGAEAENEDLQSLVKAMDYNAGWMTSVNHRLQDFGPNRLGGMDASGI